MPMPFPSRVRRAPIAVALALLAGATGLTLSAGARAAPLQLTVTIENLAPAGSVSFAPLHLGFHGGQFDSFDLGSVATAPIISVAELGAGTDWKAAFAAADPTATIGSVLPLPLLPGGTGQATFSIDPTINPYFSFAVMALPSNDFFLGNDSPTAYRLFDASGQLQIAQITQTARDLWDAGSEVFDPASAAFVGDIAARADQHSVVARNFAELAAFDGLLTGAGYVFDSQLVADTPLYRIGFQVAAVPEPEVTAMMLAGLLAVGWVARRRQPA